MTEKNKIRKEWLNIRINENELSIIRNFYKKSTFHSLSAYARNTLLKKPVIIKYRNESADELLSEMIALKNELNAIGNNYNQAVHKLHILDHIPEIKSWLTSHENLHQSFLIMTKEIRNRMNEIYSQWLQKSPLPNH